MTKAMRLLVVVACVALISAGLTGPAHGFFPKGGYNFAQQMRYASWPFREFDTNGNGVIEPGEGLEFRIESGPRGFTNAEIEQVRAGFNVWQNVPTSYATFRFVGSIEDPIAPGTIGPDYLPMVFMQVTGVSTEDGFSVPDDPAVQVPGLSWFIPALTFVTYTIDTAVIEVAGNQVFIPAGTILDCDIVVNADVHRPGVVTSTTFGTLDLQATVAHHVGQLLGLAYTPLNNLDPFNEVTLEQAALGLPVEPAVLQITGSDGVRRMLGATPTMFPIYFLTEMPSGGFQAGWRDLAPDDISGVSWLYPRQDGLENYFSISQEARTQVRRNTGVPSSPISGAHSVAWASVSPDSGDTRVPLFSTMSGLYQKYVNVQLQGRFKLMGLWKQFEVPGRLDETFEPSYVFTMSPLNGLGYDRQSPPFFTSEDFDSMQGQFPLSYSLLTRPSGDFSTNYPSEVYNEFGNIYGIDNNTAGTPLVWSFVKNTMVSANTDKTLPAMLPRNQPMFGDPDDVCPMNIIENLEGGTTENVVLDGVAGLLSLENIGGGSGGAGGSGGNPFTKVNNNLRAFRDTVLLKSAVGTALVDAYYRMAPWMARHLVQHELSLRMARGLLLAAMFIVESGKMMAALLASLTFLLVYRRLRGRATRVAAAAVLVLVLGISSAFAGQTPVPTVDLVAESNYIVTGEVISAEGRLAPNNRIYTDVVVKVREVVKGQLNRGSNLSFSVIGGQVGNLVTSVSSVPGFVQGDQALMYFQDTPQFGIIPFGGNRSKTKIILNPETGEEELVTDGTWVEDTTEKIEVNDSEGDAETSRRTPVPPVTTPTGNLPVKEYLRYLREIVRSQQ